MSAIPMRTNFVTANEKKEKIKRKPKEFILYNIYVCVVVYVISYIRYTRTDWHVE